jgi:hypothetical protein
METSLLQEYYCVDGHAVDHFVAAINCHFACNPLLNCNHQSMFELWSVQWEDVVIICKSTV